MRKFANERTKKYLLTNRSIGLHREADMIEQQLKMKQTPGPMAIPSGKTFIEDDSVRIRIHSILIV